LKLNQRKEKKIILLYNEYIVTAEKNINR
jgi:hypothetical protein